MMISQFSNRLRMVLVPLDILADVVLGKSDYFKNSNLPKDIKIEGMGQRVEDYEKRISFFIVSSPSFDKHDPNMDPPLFPLIHNSNNLEEIELS